MTLEHSKPKHIMKMEVVLKKVGFERKQNHHLEHGLLSLKIDFNVDQLIFFETGAILALNRLNFTDFVYVIELLLRNRKRLSCKSLFLSRVAYAL